jgi:nucleoside 2-deoxyribosyltransferase
MKVYFAGPLFTQNERVWNRRIAMRMQELDVTLEIFMPQEVKIDGKYNDPKKYGKLFEILRSEIDDADVMVAVLDGPDADSGTAWEVGYACGKGKPVIGVRTDFRKNDDGGLNVMLRRCLAHYVFHMSFSEDPDLVAKEIVRKIDLVRKEIVGVKRAGK